MSLEAIQWALFDAPTKNPAEQVILTVMADRSGQDGRGFEGCWASQAWIAESVGLSISTVKRHLRNMESRGLIYRGDQSLTAHLRPDRRPVVWNLNPSLRRPKEPPAEPENGGSNQPNSTGGQNEPPLTGDRTGGHLRPNGGSQVSYKPSRPVHEPSNPPSSPPRGDSPRPQRGAYLPDDWQPDPGNLARLTEKYPDLNSAQELQAFRDYWASASGQRARKRNWDAALRTWFANARRYNRPAQPQRQPSSVAAWLGEPQHHEAVTADAEIIDAKELPRWTG